MSLKEISAQSNVTRMLTALAALVILVAGLKVATSLLVPFLLAGFIAIISAGPMFWLTRRRVPRVFAVLLVVSGILVIAFGLFAVVGTSVDEFKQALPTYQTKVTERAAPLIAWFASKGFDVAPNTFLEFTDPSAIWEFVRRLLSSLGGVLTNGFLILFTVVFILLEAASFPAKLRAILGDPKASLDGFHSFIRNVERYMEIKTLVSVLTGGLIGLWLWVLGVDFALVWGLLAFLLNFVPNIGSIIAAVPAVLLAWVQLGSLTAALAALGFLVANTVMGNIVEPRFMGRGLGLSTLVVFMSLVFWGWVLGPVGMLLSVPLTITLKLALDSHQDTRWVATLLGSEADVIQPDPGKS